jgi:hypothetical protein
VVTLIAVALGIAGWRRITPATTHRSFVCKMPAGASPDLGIALPDGRRLAFFVVNQDGARSAWVRTGTTSRRVAPGADDLDTNPLFWSPDAGWDSPLAVWSRRPMSGPAEIRSA